MNKQQKTVSKNWTELWEELDNWEIPDWEMPNWEIKPQEWERLTNGWQELADSLNPTPPQERGGTKEEEYRR